MSGSPDYILSVNGVEHPSAELAAPPQGRRSALVGRPWLAVLWKCCHQYSRIYRDRAGTMYRGRCPGCGKVAQAKVGPGGVDSRFFTAC